jgi:pyruvate formate lyase activating enzyme
MTHIEPTPPATLARARRIALDHGLNYVYTGNVHDRGGGSTWCPQCKSLLIERDWYEIGTYALTDDGHCRHCGHQIPGLFKGPAGNWGSRRVPVRIQ